MEINGKVGIKFKNIAQSASANPRMSSLVPHRSRKERVNNCINIGRPRK